MHLVAHLSGFGTVDWPIEKLAADTFVILRFWDGDDILSHLIRDAHEFLQMETGLDGNILSRPFSKLSGLATHSEDTVAVPRAS